MRKINFTKMVASGNDFVIVQNGRKSQVASYKSQARKICDRKYGIGADGLLLIEKSKKADIKMRVFNADGSEAEMCGNGARCVALYAKRYTLYAKYRVAIETKAGIIESEVNGDNVKIRLTDPKGIRLDIPVRMNNRRLLVNFINTGVPHTVIFAEGLDNMDVANLGRQIRYYPRFLPAGTNVDFVEILSDGSVKIRTYERGVEDETFACGTGAVAAALLSAIRYPLSAIHKINVITKNKETLKVYFDKSGTGFTNVWLEGPVKIVYKGVCYV